jgi:hypothetical protein
VTLTGRTKAQFTLLKALDLTIKRAVSQDFRPLGFSWNHPSWVPDSGAAAVAIIDWKFAKLFGNNVLYAASMTACKINFRLTAKFKLYITLWEKCMQDQWHRMRIFIHSVRTIRAALPAFKGISIKNICTRMVLPQSHAPLHRTKKNRLSRIQHGINLWIRGPGCIIWCERGSNTAWHSPFKISYAFDSALWVSTSVQLLQLLGASDLNIQNRLSPWIRGPCRVGGPIFGFFGFSTCGNRRLM